MLSFQQVSGVSPLPPRSTLLGVAAGHAVYGSISDRDRVSIDRVEVSKVPTNPDKPWLEWPLSRLSGGKAGGFCCNPYTARWLIERGGPLPEVDGKLLLTGGRFHEVERPKRGRGKGRYIAVDPYQDQDRKRGTAFMAWLIDPQAQKWESLPDCPVSLSNHYSATVNGRVHYVYETTHVTYTPPPIDGESVGEGECPVSGWRTEDPLPQHLGLRGCGVGCKVSGNHTLVVGRHLVMVRECRGEGTDSGKVALVALDTVSGSTGYSVR
ncbi:hypothetical protein KIPB_009192 [Kipferlia bialata]|uniref:Uncharacterized protein n=1 Tax=Kipferlia bialata TaxID=797122 RepID=A0A9K3D1X6_9EUKA|nr:hypothetical protein KIPB_009192 [Kipferlia bialata]|eukprot:g9192.t1